MNIELDPKPPQIKWPWRVQLAATLTGLVSLSITIIFMWALVRVVLKFT